MKRHSALLTLSAVALMGLWGCQSSQVATSSKEVYDDLYASADELNAFAGTKPREYNSQQQSQYNDVQRNPEYYSKGSGSSNENYNDDYYNQDYLSARNFYQYGGSAYSNGFTNGWNSAMGNSWNRFWSPGISFGIGSSFGMTPLYSPYYGMSSFGLSPFGYNPYSYNGWNTWSSWNSWSDPFYSSYAYNPFGYNSWNTWNSWGYGGFGSFGGFNNYGYGGGWGGNTYVVINNNNRPNDYYSGRTYGPRYQRADARSNDRFDNSVRYTTQPGGRQGYNSEFNNLPRDTYKPSSSGAVNNSASDGYYARPRSNRGSYEYTQPNNSDSYSRQRTNNNYNDSGSRNSWSNQNSSSNSNWSNSNSSNNSNSGSRGSVGSSSSGSDSGASRSRGPR